MGNLVAVMWVGHRLAWSIRFSRVSWQGVGCRSCGWAFPVSDGPPPRRPVGVRTTRFPASRHTLPVDRHAGPPKFLIALSTPAARRTVSTLIGSAKSVPVRV